MRSSGIVSTETFGFGCDCCRADVDCCCEQDYARKQWAGLVGDYYLPRVEQYVEQGLADADAGR